jgi:hypothetical protein
MPCYPCSTSYGLIDFLKYFCDKTQIFQAVLVFVYSRSKRDLTKSTTFVCKLDVDSLNFSLDHVIAFPAIFREHFPPLSRYHVIFIRPFSLDCIFLHFSAIFFNPVIAFIMLP